MKKTIITILGIVFSLSVFAQNTPTPYQKKQLELSKKYYQIFYGQRMTMTAELFYEQLAEGEDVQEFLLAVGIINYASRHSKAQVEKVLAQMEKEYAAAEKLKNKIDFQIEREAKARKEKAQKEQEQLRLQAEFERSERGLIQRNIRSEFLKWNQKGEFEKEADYLVRLQNKSQEKFDDICLQQIKKGIEDKIEDQRYGGWRKTLSPYNAEEEFFIISFKIGSLQWQSTINIPIEQAENFKKIFYDMEYDIGEYDWCFVENSLCPSLITLSPNDRNNAKYQIPVSLQNQYEISQSFDDLKIDNNYLDGHVFKLSDAKGIIERNELKKQRIDSLLLTTFNNRLDSIYQDYNVQLLADPYNLERSVLPDYERIKSQIDNAYGAYGEYNENDLSAQYIYKLAFDKIAIKMELEFDNLKNDNRAKRNREYQVNRELFTTEAEFDTFYTNDIQIYKAEIYKRKIFNIFSFSKNFIKTMDFQKEASRIENYLPVSNFIDKYKNYTHTNYYGLMILSVINECKHKTYYSQLIDFVVEINDGLNKEYTKNGWYFANKTEFYNAFISGSYKDILKEKKKEEKKNRKK